MKFYLAGAYNLKYYLRLVRDKLEELGHTVTSRWLNETERLDFKEDELPHEELGERAEHDIADIEEADCLLHFQLKSMPNLRGGAISEKGIAIAKGKLVGIVGDRVNIFDYMDNVMLFASFDDLFRWAALECGNNEKLDSLISKITPENVHGECQCGCRGGVVAVQAGEKLERGTPCVMGEDGKAYSAIPKCWCGKELHVDCDPDEFDRGGQITQSYYCLTHGQHYMEPQGIGISGKARAGKNVLGAELGRILGLPLSSFASSLKREWFSVHFPDRFAMNDTDDIVEEVDRMKLEDETVRPELIGYGQWRRSQDEDYWIKQLDYTKRQIITDLRFQNEALALQAKGFYLIRIECSPETLKARGCPPIDDISETNLDNFVGFDQVVFNDETLEDLLKSAEVLAGRVKKLQGSI